MFVVVVVDVVYVCQQSLSFAAPVILMCLLTATVTLVSRQIQYKRARKNEPNSLFTYEHWTDRRSFYVLGLLVL